MDKVERGIQAKFLLENPLLKEVLNTLDETYHASWHAATTVEAREDLHRYVTLIGKFTADLQSIATTGALERKRLDELEGKQRYNSWQIQKS